MEFRVLGPLCARNSLGPIHLTGDRYRRLLATLLIDIDRVVSLSRLTAAVWHDDPPATAKRQIQNCLSALRRQLVDDPGEPTIVMEGDGYRLLKSAGSLDAQEFQDRVASARRLVTAGRPAMAVTELRAGLGLWRGAAFQGITGRLVEAAAARLDEQRLAATEDCLDLHLDLGRSREVIGELTELVAANPLRERLVGQLMSALYRSGRQAEALVAYHALRTRLADELGVGPGEELRERYVAILNSDPAAGTPVQDGTVVRAGGSAGVHLLPVPAQLPSDVAGFAGRAEHLAALDGVSHAAVVTGMAGVGKTAFAVHWGHLVRDRFPDGQLYVNLRGFDRTTAPMTPGEAIKGFLDAFAIARDQVPTTVEAQAALYRSLLAGRRVLVVLDNARDADQVRPLLPGSPTSRVVITSRHRLSGLIAGEGAHPIVLDLLTTAEAGELMAGRLGAARVAAEPAATDEIIARCAGLPLALAIVAARAARHPRFPLSVLASELREDRDGLDAFDGEDLLTDVRAVFSWSYQALSAPAARLFRLLALHPGPDISAAAANSLARGPVVAAGAQPRRTVAELVGAHLLVDRVPQRYAMHDLLRMYGAELAQHVDTEAERQSAVRWLLDYYLHTAHAAACRQHPQRHPRIELPPSSDVATEGFANSAQATAWFAAEHQTLLAAIAQAVRTGFQAHVWRLAWTVAEFLDRQGHWDDWVTTQRSALCAARRAQDQVGQAHAHRSLGRAYVRLQRAEQAVSHLREAFDLFGELGDHPAQARTHLDLAWAYDTQRQHEQALDHADQALALFRAFDDRNGQADALYAVGYYHALRGDRQQALGYCERALGLHQELGYRRGQAVTWAKLGFIRRELGDDVRASECYRHALSLFREGGSRIDEADMLAALGDIHDAGGDRSAARQCWQQALSIFRALHHPSADQVWTKLRRAPIAAT